MLEEKIKEFKEKISKKIQEIDLFKKKKNNEDETQEFETDLEKSVLTNKTKLEEKNTEGDDEGEVQEKNENKLDEDKDEDEDDEKKKKEEKIKKIILYVFIFVAIWFVLDFFPSDKSKKEVPPRSTKQNIKKQKKKNIDKRKEKKKPKKIEKPSPPKKEVKIEEPKKEVKFQEPKKEEESSLNFVPLQEEEKEEDKNKIDQEKIIDEKPKKIEEKKPENNEEKSSDVSLPKEEAKKAPPSIQHSALNTGFESKNQISKIKYVDPPTYDFSGRGLVYNCKGKHWACVNKKSYLDCKQNALWSIQNKQKQSCITRDVYKSYKDCIIVQIYNINTKEDVQECEK